MAKILIFVMRYPFPVINDNISKKLFTSPQYREIIGIENYLRKKHFNLAFLYREYCVEKNKLYFHFSFKTKIYYDFPYKDRLPIMIFKGLSTFNRYSLTYGDSKEFFDLLYVTAYKRYAQFYTFCKI